MCASVGGEGEVGCHTTHEYKTHQGKGIHLPPLSFPPRLQLPVQGVGCHFLSNGVVVLM